MRIRARHLRIATQTVFLVAFCALFFGLSVSRVPGWVASLLLSLDPLTTLSNALADWTVPAWTWLGLVVLGATAFLGRFFCGWICPLGTLQQIVSWIAGPERRKRNKINRYRRWFSLKYIVLTVILVWAALGANHARLACAHRLLAHAHRSRTGPARSPRHPQAPAR